MFLTIQINIRGKTLDSSPSLVPQNRCISQKTNMVIHPIVLSTNITLSTVKHCTVHLSHTVHLKRSHYSAQVTLEHPCCCASLHPLLIQLHLTPASLANSCCTWSIDFFYRAASKPMQLQLVWLSQSCGKSLQPSMKEKITPWWESFGKTPKSMIDLARAPLLYTFISVRLQTVLRTIEIHSCSL